MKLFTVLVFLAVLSLSVAFLSDLLRLKAVSAIIGGSTNGASANSGGHAFTKLLWCKKTPSEYRWPCLNSNGCKSLVQLQCVSGRCCAMDYGTLMLIDK